MTRPSRYPVASFGPELMAALVKGAETRIEIHLETAREMQWLQQRIHMLRGAMGKEKHPNYTLAQRARTSRQWDEPEGTPRTGKPTKSARNFRLVIEPNDVQFKSALEAAGVKIDNEAMRDVLDDTTTDIPTDPSVEPATEPTHVPTDGVDPYANFK